MSQMRIMGVLGLVGMLCAGLLSDRGICTVWQTGNCKMDCSASQNEGCCCGVQKQTSSSPESAKVIVAGISMAKLPASRTEFLPASHVAISHSSRVAVPKLGETGGLAFLRVLLI